ncbi:MFS transporter [Helcobacillus massiliensis]|uniref:MFS transporter n=1 Tax=Helcobacillus massiliensis TaxID=521392 RepID=UPI0021A6EA42|nr:MFS transporter [Helcobacillus massiliensis]MCT1557724.1 MFS transporter [Helcobacillus massiliensis]MCT2035996.1 MFS transporter [Helcobacillus massiliensis]MCT2331734.1 MFS transporter [Helcobacillus massiliensis]
MPPRSYATLTPAGRRFALFAIAIGGFGIGTSEFISMGLLPDIARSLLAPFYAQNPDAATAKAGIAVSAYAAGVVIGAPVLSLLSVTMSRPKLIIGLGIGLLFGTLLSASMPTFELTVIARFLAGLPHGAFFGVAALLAADVMGPGNQGKGIALALSGLTVANLAGVPLLTAFGQSLGWRTAYQLVAGIFALTVVLLLIALPPQPPPRGRSIRDELSAFRSKRLWMVLVIDSVGFLSMFAVFGYIADISTSVAGMQPAYIPLILACAGLGMTIGNIVGGHLADWSFRRSPLLVFPFFVASLFLLIPLASFPVGLAVGIVVLMGLNACIHPSLQAWLMDSAGESVTLGAALHHGAFNIANSLGVAAGGIVVAAGFGFRAPIILAAGLGVFGWAITALGLTLDRRRRPHGDVSPSRPIEPAAAPTVV